MDLVALDVHQHGDQIARSRPRHASVQRRDLVIDQGERVGGQAAVEELELQQRLDLTGTRPRS